MRFSELKVFLSCMLPCVKYNHASYTAQGCCQEYTGASHAGGGRRLSWVRYFSVSSVSMLQLLRFVLCQDEFSKALTVLRRGTRLWAAPRVDGASETQFLSSFRDFEQLFPDWEDEQNLRHFRMFCMRKAAYAWVVAYAQSDLDSNAPGSKTQCDRDSRAARKSFD